MVRRLRQSGVTQPIIGGHGYDRPLLLSVGGRAANDVDDSTHAFMSTPGIQKFDTAFQKAYGNPPASAFAALGYDMPGPGRRRDPARRRQRPRQDPRRPRRHASLSGNHWRDLLPPRRARARQDGLDDRGRPEQADADGRGRAEMCAETVGKRASVVGPARWKSAPCDLGT